MALLKKTLKYTFIMVAFAFLLPSCKKDVKQPEKVIIEEIDSSTPVFLRKLNNDEKQFIEDKKIIVVLGYGYNDENSVKVISDGLSENFGLQTEENDGLIEYFVFPNDFMRGTSGRISSLADKIEDKNVCGLVILGAPEGTHSVLSKIQDRNEEKDVYFPVFSFFPQDDILGTESTSDFVLDYAHKTNSIESEVTDFIPDFNPKDLISNAILEIIKFNKDFGNFKDPSTYVMKLFDGKRKISHYIDGETGLKSINHFIFE